MVDDGAKSWEIAVEMVKMAERDGVTDMVATPHANYEYVYDREQHTARLAELQSKVGNRIKLHLGCDFHFSSENIEDCAKHPDRYVIGKTRYQLIELSDFNISPQFMNSLFRMTSMGLVPILTHPERNAILQRQPERVREWVEIGMLVQITANSFTGGWGKPVQKLSNWYCEQGLVHFIASDAHSTNHRSPIMSEARKAIAKNHGEELATQLAETNPLAVVNNQPIAEL